MPRILFLIATVIPMFTIFGCSTEPEPPLQGWQAIHSNADGDGWRGPIRNSNELALADAEAYSRKQSINRDEIMILAIYPGMNTSGQLPPNPLAERKVEMRVTLEAIVGYWEIVDKREHASTVTNFLDIRSDGRCKTDFGARFSNEHFSDFDTVKVLTDSAFLIEISRGESYVFAVTRFDGENMHVLVDGWKQQPLELARKTHPSGLKLAEP